MKQPKDCMCPSTEKAIDLKQISAMTLPKSNRLCWLKEWWKWVLLYFRSPPVDRWFNKVGQKIQYTLNTDGVAMDFYSIEEVTEHCLSEVRCCLQFHRLSSPAFREVVNNSGHMTEEKGPSITTLHLTMSITPNNAAIVADDKTWHSVFYSWSSIPVVMGLAQSQVT